MNVATLDLLSYALHSRRCLLLVLSKPLGSVTPCRKVSIRPIALKQHLLYQFTYQFPTKETHENLDAAPALTRIQELFPASFAHANLYTTDADYLMKSRKGEIHVVKRSASKTAEPREHNRSKHYLILPDVPCPFLAAIGVMTESGQVRAAKFHKFRQINRFLELVEDILPELPRERRIRVVDFGCGKSYLTFALHHLLVTIHGLSVEILGLDRKLDVVAHCENLARRLDLQGLTFRAGDIAEHEETEPVDLAVSLHACDTATDAALAKAVAWQSRVILAVPCCQHELAPQLRSEMLEPLLRHGILRERLAALVTDALRAQALELCGYTTAIVEFIDLEHTAKNLLLRAVRREGREVKLEEKEREYERMMRELSVMHFAGGALGPRTAVRGLGG